MKATNPNPGPALPRPRRSYSVSLRRRARAFSLIEMLIVMLIVGVMLAGLSVLFSRTSYIARTQSELATLQQSLRVAHQEMTTYLRMAGAGGLPIAWNRLPGVTVDYTTMGSFPNGFAVRLQNNVVSGTTVGGHSVMPLSDVLTVRGVFTTPVYYLNEQEDVVSQIDATDKDIDQWTLTIRDRISGAFRYDLEPLIDKISDALGGGDDLAFILRDLANPDAYFIVQLHSSSDPSKLTPAACPLNAAEPPTWVASTDSDQCISFDVKLKKSGTTLAKELGNLSMGTILQQADSSTAQIELPGGATQGTLNVPKQIGSIGILEEFRYYVRAEFEVPGDSSSRLRPILSRAEYLPGTETLIETVDIAEGIIDMQIAAGIETDTKVGATGFGEITDSGDENDEVLFNSAADAMQDTPALLSLENEPRVWYNPEVDYHYLRITTLAESKVPNLSFWTPGLQFIEDHDLRTTVSVDGANYTPSTERRFPRSYLQSVIELRNLK